MNEHRTQGGEMWFRDESGVWRDENGLACTVRDLVSEGLAVATVRRVRMTGGTTGPWFRYYVDCPCAGERGYLTFFDDYRAARDAREFAATHNAIGHGPVH